MNTTGLQISDGVSLPIDAVTQRFGISKSAFKRALGKLMREGAIVQKGSWTHLASQTADEAEASSERE